MRSTAEILTAARGLICTPDRWVQGDGATDSLGNSVSMRHPSATCRCTLFAILTVGSGAEAGLAIDTLRQVIDLPEDVSLPEWNDTPGRTHADVMAAFDAAIAAEMSAA